MKGRRFLFSVIAFTIVVEILLIILVHQSAGPGRLPFQIARLTFQLAVAWWLFKSKSQTALVVLVGYHLITPVVGYSTASTHNWLSYSLIGFHWGPDSLSTSTATSRKRSAGETLKRRVPYPACAHIVVGVTLRGLMGSTQGHADTRLRR